MFGLVILSGCAGTKVASESDVPDWYLNPPKYEDRFVGVGDALRPQMSPVSYTHLTLPTTPSV